MDDEILDSELVAQMFSDRSVSDDLIPYLMIHETADRLKCYKLLQSIRVQLKWRNYYSYNDAIRTIDLINTKGIYDYWTIFIEEENKEFADKILEQEPDFFSYFKPFEEKFLRGLDRELLIKILGSREMKGVRLDLAKKILEEEGVTFSDQEIAAFKKELRVKNLEGSKNTKSAISIIWGLVFWIIAIYLYFVFG